MKKFRIGDKVRVNKNIYRVETSNMPYAMEGEIGIIEEIFKSNSGKWSRPHINAKVRVGEVIKTFKLGSLELCNGI